MKPKIDQSFYLLFGNSINTPTFKNVRDNFLTKCYTVAGILKSPNFN